MVYRQLTASISRNAAMRRPVCLAEDAVTSETVSPPDLPAIARFAGRISEIAGSVDP